MRVPSRARPTAPETTAISENRQDEIVQQAADWIRQNTVNTHELRIVAEPRPESLRAAVRGNRAVVYQGKLYSAFLQECIKQAAEQKPAKTLTGDIYGLIEVICTRPKATKRLRPGSDVDNYAKGALDALTQCAIYDDDESVVSLSVHKRWAKGDEQAGVKVVLGVLPGA